MASQALSQALLAMPRNLIKPPLNRLGFSTVLSTSSSSFNCAPLSISRVSVPTAIKRSFVVRAESNSEEGEPETTENVEEREAVDEEVPQEESEVTSEAEVEEKPPRKPRVKLGDIMGILNKRAIEASEKERPVPDIRTGDIVEIKLEVPENRRRLSIYKGIVMSKQNAGIHTTIRIRRIIAGIGVEIVFPLYSPNIKEIKVVNHRKVRRARLYYLRDKLPRFSTFK
ncbi:Ribosomal protein L19 [Dillenia turbinata]|uniref:Ribosomal protein L19 n=1 Tax=Dillenia turbinata TaxID=194707 RepID=A0AAN8ZMV2_9MAGN